MLRSSSPGTNNVSKLPLIAVGSTFKLLYEIDNTESISQGISAYSYGLVWDPAVLNLTKVNDRTSFLLAGEGPDGSITHIVTGPGNNSGKITVNDVILNFINASASASGSGVLSTITFQVLAVGQSNINLQPSDVGVAYLDYPNGMGDSLDVSATAISAIYGNSVSPTPTPTTTSSPSPTPTSSPSPTSTPTATPSPTPGSSQNPIAKINISNGTVYQVGDQKAPRRELLFSWF